MGKPRGTKRRTAVLSSDDEHHGSSQSGTTRPNKSRSVESNTPQSSSKEVGLELPPKQKQLRSSDSGSRAGGSPEKKQQKAAASKPKPKEKTLYSFFNKATQAQSFPSAAFAPANEIDDIEDDSDEHHSVEPNQASKENDNPAANLPVRKRPHDGISDGNGSNKFLRTDHGRAPPAKASHSLYDNRETKPWTDRFAPQNFEELAVHKKKVADIRTWLCNVFDGLERKRLLVLKGPAGSGKTATITLLAKDLDFSIQEWRNPTSSVQGTDGLVSMSAQFDDFLSRSGTFGSLSLETSTEPQPDKNSKEPGGRQIVLIEEFPNSVSSASSSTQMFRKSILRFLAAQTPSASAFFSQKPAAESITPVVMVISETLLSMNTSSADSFTAHRLLGQEILTHPGVTVIEFNPVAPTFLSKALELVTVKEARISGRRKTPGPQVIKHLSEIGDVRSAISSLQFLCLRGDEQDGWGTRIAFSKQKRGAKDVPMTEMEKESLESITQRESTLGIFHAVGKVVYNKRLETPSGAPQPPPHLVEKSRPRASAVDVESLIDELGTDISTFISALHENYALSCNGLTDEDSLESLDGCIESLSGADLLSPDRFSGNGSARRIMQGTGSDALRQEEISFHIAVRGILFHLPSPVKRVAPPGAGRGDAFRMFYPVSLRLWRRREEIEGQIDLWVEKAQKGLLKIPSRSNTGAPFKRSQGPWTPGKASGREKAPPAGEDEQPPVLLAGGSSDRREMLLERLPFVVAIYRADPCQEAKRLVKDIQEIITFTGIGDRSDEIPDEDDGGTVRSPKARRMTGRDKKKASEQNGNANTEVEEGERGVAGLFLSDDDIEDD